MSSEILCDLGLSGRAPDLIMVRAAVIPVEDNLLDERP